MAPKADDSNPKLVVCPKERPDGRTYFDWSDKALLEWKKQAIRLQDLHVKDNNRTEWFKYNSIDDRDALELRLCMVIYGVRTPKEESKTPLYCPLRGYTREERRSTRDLIKKITKNSENSRSIMLNVIYISTATKVEKDKNSEFLASEVPIFVVNGKQNKRIFIEKDGRIYTNFEDLEKSNQLPKGPMVYPRDGSYTPSTDKKSDDDRVILELNETPSTGFLERCKSITGTVVMIGGIVLSVAGVVTFFGPALLTQTVATAMQYGSFLLSGYSILMSSASIYDKIQHDQGIRTETLSIITSVFTIYTGFLRNDLMKQAKDFASKGKTFNELIDRKKSLGFYKVGNFRKNLFLVSNILTIASSSSSLVSALYDLCTKKERTWFDYFQLSMSLFMFVNVVTKPITLKGVFESEQMKYLNGLCKSEEAKKAMSKMLNDYKSSDDKAYFIRNVNRIDNPSEFFYLIGKTNSDVRFTSDGMTINDKLDITQEAYNQIGKGVFDARMNEISKTMGDLPSRIGDLYADQVPADRRESFQKSLSEIKNLPADEQKQRTVELIKNFSGQDLNVEEFDQKWTDSQNNLNRQVEKVVTDLRQGSTSPQQENDFKRLEELAKKQTSGTITPSEFQELKDKLQECSKHRKEYLFSSSNREQPQTAEQKAAFKRDIDTFTNGRNERLCYRITVDEVKQRLIDVTGQENFQDVQVNGQKIFENMKTTDYDRINRVMDSLGKKGNEMLQASISIANDPSFQGEVKTPYDIMSITEALNSENRSDRNGILEALKMPQEERAKFKLPDNPTKNDLTIKENLEKYNKFLSRFNDTIDKVNNLNPDIRTQWSSPLSMAYHYMKHKSDFESQPISMEKYFIDYSERIFKPSNVTWSGVNQVGNFRTSYACNFGQRVHVGFTAGSNQTKCSHFTK